MYGHLPLMVIPQPLAQQAREAYARSYPSSSITVIVIRIKRGTQLFGTATICTLDLRYRPKLPERQLSYSIADALGKGSQRFHNRGSQDNFQSRCQKDENNNQIRRTPILGGAVLTNKPPPTNTQPSLTTCPTLPILT